MAFPESEISLILSFEGKFLASVDFLSKESGPFNINDDLIWKDQFYESSKWFRKWSVLSTSGSRVIPSLFFACFCLLLFFFCSLKTNCIVSYITGFRPIVQKRHSGNALIGTLFVKFVWKQRASAIFRVRLFPSSRRVRHCRIWMRDSFRSIMCSPVSGFCFALLALGAPSPQNPCVSHFLISSQNLLILLPCEPKNCSPEIDSFRAVCV